MADDNSHIARTLDDMRRQATEKLEEVKPIIAGMNAVEATFGLPLTLLQDLVEGTAGAPPGAPTLQGSGSASTSIPKIQPRRAGQGIRPDEYLGEEPMEAAKKYLSSIGHAVHFDEIADAVQRGGAAVQGANWRERLELSLKRSPYQVITVAEKTYGLADFYTQEQLTRLRSSRRRDPEPAPKKKTKPTAKPKAKAKTEAKKKPELKKGTDDKKAVPPEAKSAKADGDKPTSDHSR